VLIREIRGRFSKPRIARIARKNGLIDSWCLRVLVVSSASPHSPQRHQDTKDHEEFDQLSKDIRLQNGPLHGKRALVASSAGKLQELVEGLEELGARALPFPTIELRALQDQSPLDAALAAIEDYSWIIFTSTHGVLFFLSRMKELNYSVERRRGIQVCAVGPSTAAALRDAGIEVSLVPEEYAAEGVLRALAKFHGGLHNLAGKKILLPRAREARDLLPRELEAAGAKTDIVVCYENVLPDVEARSLQAVLAAPPDLLVFTSSSAVNNFIKLFGEGEGRKLLMRATVAALGGITARTAAAHGKAVEILPGESTIVSLLEAIASYYDNDK
jgi:uroporphyrinogen III methyltransferase/synthase